MIEKAACFRVTLRNPYQDRAKSLSGQGKEMEEAEASHDSQILMKLNYAQELNPFE
jgi:hypothetical protein